MDAAEFFDATEQVKRELKTLIVIPARLESTRLPKKLLLCDTGKPLIQHTYEAASRSGLADKVVVAADSPEIETAVAAFDGNCVMTDAGHASGTDRIAEVAAKFEDCEIFVNVQGDEPEIDPRDIDSAISLLQNNSEVHMATLACPITEPRLRDDPCCVKVVVDQQDRALYFSRCPVPYIRDEREEQSLCVHLQHVGLYAYRRKFLLQIASLPQGALEKAEKLEQLRVLEAGHEIHVIKIKNATPGIDTAEDYAAFVSRLRS